MPWNIENYFIMNNTVLQVEITIPLMEFIYVEIEDVKDAWVSLLDQVVNEHPDYEMSWEMQPKDDDALVLVRIAKTGGLGEFTPKEAKDALAAADALFEKPEAKLRWKATPKKETPGKKKAKKRS
ncbi:MAG: hypothetical protein ACFFER_04675 [Candidatus Thorarchaeota archaeon]